MHTELRISDDGSHTLYIPELEETYHSLRGALTESRLVYIQNGLRYTMKTLKGRKIHLLEVGFGTGLNAWLTAIEAIEKQVSVNYTSLEPHPLGEQTVSRLNYANFTKSKRNQTLFNELHQAPWETTVKFSPYFNLFKKKCYLQSYKPSQNFDLIYYDAFAPQKQPDMWSIEVLNSVGGMLKKNGVLVSYCAQGKFKRHLTTLGWSVVSLPGPPGKKEMTRAIK